MSVARILLLGKPAIFYDNQPLDLSVKKAVALLAYLATTGKSHGRERLAALLWPDANDEVARTSLRLVLRSLRETPLGSLMEINRSTIGLGATIESDVQAFQTHLDRISSVSIRPQVLTLDVVTQMQHAAALYTGDFMDDFTIPGSVEWDDWQQFRRIEFQYQATRIFAALAHYYADRQLADSGLRMASRWLDLDPHNEDAHRLQMRLYALSRQTERAMEQYHLLSRLLVREQGRQPEPETRQLYDHIRTGSLQYAEIELTPGKPTRSILPRPVLPASAGEPALHQIKRALGVAGETAAAPLVVVYDPDRTASTAAIAQLAHERDVHLRFSDCILWAALDDDLDAILRLWMDALRLSVLKNTGKLEHLAWQFHNGLQGKRVLVILEHLNDEARARLLTPGYPGCSLLVTTSDRDVASRLAAHPDHLISMTGVSLAKAAGPTGPLR